jgi:tetratricopeptide (TPR) repeat protein
VGQPYQDLYEAVVELKRRHDLHPCAVHPRDGLSLRDDGERETVQDLVSRFRRLPEDTRRKLPALWNSLAQLEIVVGDLDACLADFQEVARLVADPISRAEAHHNIYRAALERRDWNEALLALRRAVVLDPDAFEPFPFERYEPRQILGGGGVGVSFLCKDLQHNGLEVVVKALRADSLDRDPGALFAEARTLQDLNHPALIGIVDMGVAGQTTSLPAPSQPPRPYLVMEYYPGQTLGEYLAEHGAFTPEDWLDIVWPLLRGLHAIHGRGILHRSLRPTSILIRSRKNRDGNNRLTIKLLDTGLALRRTLIHARASNPDACRYSGLGRSVARVIPYAPPEVVSRPKGQVWVGPHSDIWSFGRLCAFGLTGHPTPDSADRMLLPEGWQKLIESATSWTIAKRPTHTGILLDHISHIPGADSLIGRIERDLHESTIEGLSARIEANPDEVNAYLQRATAHFREGDIPGAIADYTEAIRLCPDDASLYRHRGMAHSRVNDTEGAIADYTDALRLEPRNLAALFSRGLAFSEDGEYEKAIADFTEGLTLNHRDELLYYNRGNAYFYLGQHDRAIVDYTEALRLDPRGLWSLSNRGKAYHCRGEHARAIADFTRLLQLDPANVRAWCYRAEVHLDMGRLELCMADYSEAIRLEPSAALYQERAQARARGGDLKAALEDFTEALTLSPDNPAILLDRAQVHADLEQNDAALADCTEALRITPKSFQAYLQRGEVYRLTKQYSEAIADLTTALEINPALTKASWQRALCYAEMGEHDRAIKDFTFTLAGSSNEVACLIHRGESLLEVGEIERAKADFDRVLELRADHTPALERRASAYVLLGQIDAAVNDLSAILEHDPTCAAVYDKRGQLFVEQGKHEEAIADFTTALRQDSAYLPSLLNRASVYADRGAHALALADNLTAYQLAPSDTRVLNNLAWLYATCSQPEIANPQRALELAKEAMANGEDANRLDTLAAAQAACGQFADAVETQKRAMEMASEAIRGELVARLAMYEARKAFLV